VIHTAPPMLATARPTAAGPSAPRGAARSDRAAAATDRVRVKATAGESCSTRCTATARRAAPCRVE